MFKKKTDIVCVMEQTSQPVRPSTSISDACRSLRDMLCVVPLCCAFLCWYYEPCAKCRVCGITSSPKTPNVELAISKPYNGIARSSTTNVEIPVAQIIFSSDGSERC